MLEEGPDLEEALLVVTDAKDSRANRFEIFWKAAEEILASEMVVPDERRHGTTCCISPLCVPHRTLRNKVEIKAKEIFPGREIHYPSEEYFRLHETKTHVRPQVITEDLM